MAERPNEQTCASERKTIRELLDTVREFGMCPLGEACEAPDEKAVAGDKDCAMCVRGWDALNELEARLA